MAVRPLNSIAGFSTGDPAVTVIQANGDVTTINLTANGLVNLGNVGNVNIAGGSNGQYLATDGAGNLNWQNLGNLSSNRAAPMPYLIPTGESYIVNENFQGLYTQAITIDGELEVDGMLIEMQDSIQSEPTQVLFDTNGIATGNTGFTFLNYNGNLNVPGNINLTGSIVPNADDVYDLGKANRRWKNGYFGGNTIYLDSASIAVDANGYVVITNTLGGQFVVEGNTTSGTNEIENGNSNVTVYANGNVATTIAGVANIFVVTSAGANLTGNLTTTGVKTDNLYYANGNPWDLQEAAGSNTQIQFNNNNNFGASENFTFNTATNNLTVTGNVVTNTGAYYGNAAGLTNIPGANITGNINGNISNATHALTANTVVNAAQPNITSVGTLSSVSVTGNTISGNVYANSGTIGANLLSGTITTANQPNITSVGTLTNLSVNGNATIDGNLVVNGNLIYVNVEELSIEDPIINLNTGPNGAAPNSNSGKDVGSALNYYDTQARIAFMGWDTSNAEFAFGSRTSIADEVVTFNTLGNLRANTYKGNLEGASATLTANLSANNISGGNLITANYLTSTLGCVVVGTSMIVVSSNTAGIFNTTVDTINLGLAANVNLGSNSGATTAKGNLISENNIFANTGNIVGNLLTGTITTNAQPNITSLGNLTSLNVIGNATSNISIANIAKVNSTVSKRTSISVSTLTVIDSFSISDYRTAKYTIKSGSDLGFESLEVLLIHNDINSYVTVYGAINTGGANTVTISTAINNGNVELKATGLGSNTVVNLIGTYVPD